MTYFVIFHTSLLQAQLGFVEPECGIVANTAYYINNVSGNHSFSYYLYHNGVVIKQQNGSGNGGGFTASGLKFINDTTGFYQVYQTGGQITIYKISGEKVTYTGWGATTVYSLYVLNAYTAYLVTNVNGNNLWITKCTDVPPARRLIDDKLFTSDTTVIDTVTGTPTCADLTSLTYRYKRGNDTINYTILLYLADSSYAITEKSNQQFEVFPNPVTSRFGFSFNGTISSIEILTMQGKTIYSDSNPKQESPWHSLSLANQAAGMYVLKVATNRSVMTRKIIKTD